MHNDMQVIFSEKDNAFYILLWYRVSLRNTEEEIMNLKQLQYFLEFSKSKNITQAAKRLYITQQGMSKAIHSLENELGYMLFRQENGVIQLTPYGEVLARYCGDIQNSVEQLEQEFKRIRSLETKALHINIAPIIRLMLPFNVSDEFREKYPELRLFEGNLLDLEAEDMLVTEQLDALIGLGPVFNNRFNATPLFSYPASAVMRHTHPLAGRKELTLRELCGQELAVVDEKYKTISLLKKACERQGLVPHIAMSPSSSSMLYRVCMEYGYLGLSYYTRGKEMYQQEYDHVPIRMSEFCFECFLIVNTAQHQSDALRQYLRFIRNYPFQERLSDITGLPTSVFRFSV